VADVDDPEQPALVLIELDLPLAGNPDGADADQPESPADNASTPE
jgi:hypothetical protein